MTNAADAVLGHGAERLGWWALGQATDHGRCLWALVALVACALVALVAVVAARRLGEHARARRVRSAVMGPRMVPAAEFLADWRAARPGSGPEGGYKALDRPGCYVIVTRPDRGWRTYQAVYVGQSLHVCSRVRAHLTGHGNGDVYADVRAGEPVYVRLVPCEPERMNEVERGLISAFRATRYYNKTRGGATRR